MDQQPAISIVDPDPRLAAALDALLQTYDIKVSGFEDVSGFLDALNTNQLADNILLLSLDFPGIEPADVLAAVCGGEHRLPTIAICHDPDAELQQLAIDAGALDLVRKSLLAAYLFNRLQDHCPGVTGLPRTDVATLSLRDGTEVTFRMMSPDDAEIEQAFVTALSDHSRYLRFFSGLKKLNSYMLDQFTHPDFPLSYAVIATINVDGEEQQIGVARYAPTGEEKVGEFAVVVSDEWQGHGIGRELMHLVITAAAVGGLRKLEGMILRENKGMRTLAKKLGFVAVPGGSDDHSAILVAKDLNL